MIMTQIMKKKKGCIETNSDVVQAIKRYIKYCNAITNDNVMTQMLL